MEWSHSNEAYANAQENVNRKDRDWLEVVFAEWRSYYSCYSDRKNEFDEKKYNEALEEAKQITDDALAEYIWSKAEFQTTCENGGHQAHCCPFGCGCHMVSFDLEGDNSLD